MMQIEWRPTGPGPQNDDDAAGTLEDMVVTPSKNINSLVAIEFCEVVGILEASIGCTSHPS